MSQFTAMQSVHNLQFYLSHDNHDSCTKLILTKLIIILISDTKSATFKFEVVRTSVITFSLEKMIYALCYYRYWNSFVIDA